VQLPAGTSRASRETEGGSPGIRPLGSSRRCQLVVRMERKYLVQGEPGAQGVTVMHVLK
jgi:hypothetical protein